MMAALGDDAHVAQQKERYRRRRALLRPALEGAGFRIDHSEAGLYLWATRGRGRWETVERLADRGILVAPGSFYGAAGAQHVRVALTATDERIERGRASAVAAEWPPGCSTVGPYGWRNVVAVSDPGRAAASDRGGRDNMSNDAAGAVLRAGDTEELALPLIAATDGNDGLRHLEAAEGDRHRHPRPGLRQHGRRARPRSPTSTVTPASCATAATRSSSWPRSPPSSRCPTC